MVETKIIAIGAHPDDVEYFAGGTLAKYPGAVLVLATNGGNGIHQKGISHRAAVKIREGEQNQATALMGITKIIRLGFRDGELEFNVKRLKQELLKVFTTERPEIIFTFDPEKQYVMHDDFHPDHRALAIAVCDVAKIDATLESKSRHPLQCMPLMYLYDAAHPTARVKICPETKSDILKCHKSQRLSLPKGCDFEDFRVY